MKQQYIKIFLIVLGFVCTSAMSMEDNYQANLEILLQNTAYEWRYEDLCYASLVCKTWYKSIRIKKVSASQRKILLIDLLHAWALKNTTIYEIHLNRIIFHPSGCMAGCLRNRTSFGNYGQDTNYLCKFWLNRDISQKEIKINLLMKNQLIWGNDLNEFDGYEIKEIWGQSRFRTLFFDKDNLVYGPFII